MRTIQANVPGLGFCDLLVDAESIAGVEVLGPIREATSYVWRGFVDLQVNGFAGVDFADEQLSPDGLISVLPKLFSTGVTGFLPTLITNEVSKLRRQLGVFEKACQQSSMMGRATLGYHLEGPWLSPGPSHGAHDPQQMRLPECSDLRALMDAASGRVRMITIAPELPGVLDFIRCAREAGIIVAIGHTDGTAADIYRAAEAGATLSTHLGNGCPQLLDRHRAPFWAQLADDRLQASLICDTFHVTPELVKIVARVKGASRCVLVTDAMQAAMMPPGTYRIANTVAELLPSGQVVRADRTSMAGSALTMDRAVTNFQKAVGCSLLEALNSATKNPLTALGCPGTSQGITAGQPADLVLFDLNDSAICVRETLLGGERVWVAAA